MAGLKVGDRWGRMKCTGMIEKDHVFDAGEGVQGKYENEPHYVIACDCGKVIELYKGDFKSRRIMQDCGCGLALDGDVAVLVSVTMPVSVRRMLKAYASTHTNGNMSSALTEIIRQVVESTWNESEVNSAKG